MAKLRQDGILDKLLANAGWLVIALAGTSLAIVRLRHTAKDLAIRESADVTGRYMRSMDLLGSVRDGSGGSKLRNLEARLGAIYSLRRLAYDSKRDYETIMKTLCGYVRMNAVNPVAEPDLSGAYHEPAQGGDLQFDLQTAMEVIVQPCPHQGIDRYVIDVRKAYLDGLELTAANLRRADLSYATLRNATLTDCDLGGANLLGTHLTGANCDGVQLQGADLSDAVLINAGLSKARFDDQTRFTRADLSRARFYEERGAAEQARGLAPVQILEALNWELAMFSQGFERLLRDVHDSDSGV